MKSGCLTKFVMGLPRSVLRKPNRDSAERFHQSKLKSPFNITIPWSKDSVMRLTRLTVNRNFSFERRCHLFSRSNRRITSIHAPLLNGGLPLMPPSTQRKIATPLRTNHIKYAQSPSKNNSRGNSSIIPINTRESIKAENRRASVLMPYRKTSKTFFGFS